MRILVSSTQDPYFNLAAEEYLLRNYTGEVLFLYINNPSVIVGKHQNLLAEINYRYVVENNVFLARRITGGGAVFHDPGNLNYAFFAASQVGTQVNFPKYLNWVIQVLERLGISAVYEGKNNLRVDGLKISGNAGHVFKNIALHHGTLLVNANLQMLSACLKVKEGCYTDKAVKSIRAKVANLSQFRPDINVEILIEKFSEVMEGHISHFSSQEVASIQQLSREKFSSWDWVWGYSPFYTYRRHSTPWGDVLLEVEKGRIIHANIEKQPHWNKQLEGLPHDYPTLSKFIENTGFPKEEAWWFF